MNLNFLTRQNKTSINVENSMYKRNILVSILLKI